MVLSKSMVSSKSLRSLQSLVIVLVIMLSFPLIQEAKGAEVDNDFITIFGEALNTPKNESENNSELSKSQIEKTSNEARIMEGNSRHEMRKKSHNASPEKGRIASKKLMGTPWKKGHGFNNPIQLIAKSLHGLLLLMILMLLFIGGNLSLAAFSLKSLKENGEHYEKMRAQIADHKWLTLIAGLVNGGLVTLVTLILLKTMPVIGILLLSWVVSHVLHILASRILIGINHADEDEHSYKDILKRTVLELSIYIIPVYGQLELVKIIVRGVGAKVLIKTGFRQKAEQTD